VTILNKGPVAQMV